MFGKKNMTKTCDPGHFLCMRNLWLSPGLVRKKKKTLKALRDGCDTGGLHVLILPSWSSQQLEIVKGNYLIQPWYREQTIRIVGLAESMEEAKAIVLKMMQECWKDRQDADLRAYLEERVRKEGLEE